MATRGGRYFGAAFVFFREAMMIFLLFCGLVGALAGMAGVKGLDA